MMDMFGYTKEEYSRFRNHAGGVCMRWCAGVYG